MVEVMKIALNTYYDYTFVAELGATVTANCKLLQNISTWLLNVTYSIHDKEAVAFPTHYLAQGQCGRSAIFGHFYLLSYKYGLDFKCGGFVSYATAYQYPNSATVGPIGCQVAVVHCMHSCGPHGLLSMVATIYTGDDLIQLVTARLAVP